MFLLYDRQYKKNISKQEKEIKEKAEVIQELENAKER